MYSYRLQWRNDLLKFLLETPVAFEDSKRHSDRIQLRMALYPVEFHAPSAHPWKLQSIFDHFVGVTPLSSQMRELLAIISTENT